MTYPYAALATSHMSHSTRPFGELLREWRDRRHVSQLGLACAADISTRHLSFLETGRSTPSREMVLRLSRVLEVPLRERNALLHAAGFAPAFSQHPLDDPALETARRAVDLVLRGHEPFPALAIDRHWNLVASNTAVPPLIAGVDASLVKPPVNVLRLSLHPNGLAPRIRNFGQWRSHLLERLRKQIETTADARLADLLRELLDYPVPVTNGSGVEHERDYAGVVVPFELVTDAGTLALISTTTVFGTPVDITVAELALETFFPADEETGELLHDAAERRRAATARA